MAWAWDRDSVHPKGSWSSHLAIERLQQWICVVVSIGKIVLIAVHSMRGADVHWEDGRRDVESGCAGHDVRHVGGGGGGIDIRIVGDARELGLEGLV